MVFIPVRAREDHAVSVDMKSAKTKLDGECWWCGLAVLGLFALFALPFVLLFWDTDPFVKLRVRVQYCRQPTLSQCGVFIDQQPHDCKFFTAPIGNKHCHYERAVMAAPPWDRTRIEIHYARIEE